MRDSIGARTRAPSPGGEPGIHIPEAGVHGFRALGFAEPRNDEISDVDNGGSAMSAGAEKVGVVGAGLMGAEIALVFALARIRTTTALEDFADRDFVTEAVFESEEVKAEVYRALDRICLPRSILASNTSTIPISTLASYVGEARRPYFIGTHYFSPASRMKLVEVIPAFETMPETVETATRLMREADKVPVRVKDVAGFAVNRVFLIFLQEAVRLVEEGVATPEDIDTACKLGLGHPMGPFELMDATTSRLVLQASEILHDAYGERFRPPALLQQRVRAGFVGGRGGKGWRTK